MQILFLKGKGTKRAKPRDMFDNLSEAPALAPDDLLAGSSGIKDFQSRDEIFWAGIGNKKNPRIFL